MVPLKIKLPNGFLDEEVRCGYTVTKQMKEVWAVELDLLAELLRVCEKYNIKVFGDGGTLLGAVRHKGFIPWDDDIDVMMMRSDYDKLSAIGPTEFKHPYFFQTEYTDPGSLRPHAQIRNSMTTGILLDEAPFCYQHNQGIFIDVFPLDNVVADPVLFKRQKRKAERAIATTRKISRISYRYSDVPGVKGYLKRALYTIAGPIIKRLQLEQKEYARFEKICSMYDNLDTKTISQLSMDFSNKRLYRDVEDYSELITVPFEFLKVPIPKGYLHELDRRYGDWRTPMMDNNSHGGMIVDVNKSYIDYFKEKEKSK